MTEIDFDWIEYEIGGDKFRQHRQEGYIIVQKWMEGQWVHWRKIPVVEEGV